MDITSDKEAFVSPIKRTLRALEDMQAKLEAMEHSKREPIAIVGMNCRLPGNVNNPEGFWELLHNGVDAITEIPYQRWNINTYYDPNPDTLGKMYIRQAGLLSQVDRFDPQFFGISPREAMSLDPQQRLLLEVSWEALEMAGVAFDRLEDSQTGVFIGIGQNDYAQLQLYSGDNKRVAAYDATGNGFCFASGRLSYFLGLNGPSLAIDTACSSSLVAVHLACQSLRKRECNLALAGGVQLILSPVLTTALCRMGALSPDGRCKTFDAAANGYGRGEGCGVVVLKRLSDATKDRDCILAVIRGSAVNHGGSSSGLTVPNKIAQQKLIKQALSEAQVDPSDVSYVEAHGTGTSLGDPIEVKALADILGQGRSPDSPLMIGSVKTNIGHLEAAAGIAGLMKVILQMQHRKIVPHLHLKQPNPYINWDKLPVVVPTQQTPWESNYQEQLLAGVSSFGISGTNAHVILEEAPALEEISATESKRPTHLLTLSAKSEIALKELVSRYHKHLTTHPELGLEDICFTTNSGRSHFNHRLSLVASSNGELTDKLAAVSTREEVEGVFLGQQQNTVRSKIGFLFTGQGCQYVGMAKQLYETQPKFREALLKCEQIVRPYLEESLLSVLYPEIEETSPLNQTAYTQPALFAIEYALFELWKSWGISPEIVMGHSLGEYVAATVAGVFSLEDGLKLVATRARLMQALPKTGEMMVVFAELAQVQKLIESYRQEVSIAAINGPQSVVISGSGQALAKIRRDLEAVDVKSKTLEVSHPFHSPLMEPMLKDFAAVASSVKYSKPKMELISNLTGELADDRIASSQYWVDHVRSPVQFARSMETLVGQKGYECFVEIGPKPILLGMGRQCFSEDLGIWLPSLHPQKDDWQQMLSSLGQLYVKGVDVDWSGFKGDYCFNKVILPTYPFQRQRYWVETPTSQITSASASQANQLVKLHPLLNKKFQSPLSADIFFESNFSTKALPFLEDHRVYQQVVVPAACHISLLLQAAKLSFATDSCLLEDILFPQALAIAQDKELTVQLVLTPEKIGASFKLISFDNNSNFGTNTAVVDGNQTNPWVLHATGKISAGNNITTQTLSIPQIQQRCPTQMESSQLYQTLLLRQIQLGVSFRCIDSIWVGDREALCQIKLPNIIDDAANYQLHPVVIDSCLQLLVAAATSLLTTQDSTFVPFSIEKFEFYHPPISGQLWCHAYVLELEESEAQTLVGDICLFDCNGQIIAQLSGFQAKKATVQTFLESSEDSLQDWFYEVEWIPKAGFGNPLPLEYLSTPAEIEQNSSSLSNSSGARRWLILADRQGIGQQLAKQFRKNGEICTVAFPGQEYEQVKQEEFTINPERPEDFQRLIERLTAQQSLHGVVHCFCLDTGTNSDLSSEELQTISQKGCGSTLHLVQTLVRFTWSQPPRLWLVTRGAQLVNNADLVVPGVAQSSLWGMGKVIALEHPELQCTCVDLDHKTHSNQIQKLWEEIVSENAENQVVLREKTRYVSRLIRSQKAPEPTSDKPLKFREDATYLLTGGLGGLGLLVANWMVNQGARNLVLVGRSGAKDLTKTQLAELQRFGARVVVAQGDVSLLESITNVFSKIQESMPPLRGVIHAAGVLDDGVLQQQSWDRFARVMAPKIQGAWNLHILTRHQPLDFFVLFSSAASMLGSAGQANYSAANTFVDTLAYYRQTQGLPGLSINWGTVAEVGVANKLQADERAKKRGMKPLAPQQVLEALEWLMSTPCVQIGVMRIHWSQFLKQLSVSTFFSNVRETSQDSSVVRSEFLQQLEVAPDRERWELLIAHVQWQVAQVLGLNPSQPIDLEQGFFELGMDSLTSVELRNRLQNSLSCSISATLAFNYPTVKELVDYIGKKVLRLELSVDSQTKSEIPVRMSTELEQLSESDAEALLLQELEKINQ